MLPAVQVAPESLRINPNPIWPTFNAVAARSNPPILIVPAALPGAEYKVTVGVARFIAVNLSGIRALAPLLTALTIPPEAQPT